MMKGKFLIFLLGLVVGAGAAFLLPDYLVSSLPGSPWARAWATEGTVVAKQWEGDSLLLTLLTDEGATLATFTERIAEVDLLVEEGDRVSFTVRGYRPFVQDPGIRRVLKKGQIEEPPGAVDTPQAEEPTAAGAAEQLTPGGEDPTPEEATGGEPTPLPEEETGSQPTPMPEVEDTPQEGGRQPSPPGEPG